MVSLVFPSLPYDRRTFLMAAEQTGLAYRSCLLYIVLSRKFVVAYLLDL